MPAVSLRDNWRAGVGFVVLAATLWGMFGPVARLALRDGVSPLEIAMWRTLIATLLFAVHVAMTSRRKARPAEMAGRGHRAAHGRAGLPRTRIALADLPGIAAFALSGVAALYAFLPLAVEAGGATLASVLLYTAPAWVALFSWGLLGERLTPRTLLALALTLCGIAGIALAGEAVARPSRAALGWGLAAGLSYASLYLFGKYYFARYPPPLVFLTALPIAGLALLPFTRFGPVTPVAAGALMVLGVASTYAAYLAYSAGLARLPATRAATIATAEPVIASLLAFAIWDERLPLGGYAASVLVLLGVVIMATTPAADG
jgi:DME family drug/metabolite transporter